MFIDIPILIINFASQLTDSITNNWIVYETCYVTLGHSRSECALLGSTHPDNFTAKLEEKVEPYAGIIITSNLIIGAIGGPIISFFIGAWSDKYGRKPVFMIAVGGFALNYLIIALVCSIPNLSPWFILLSNIPVCLSGGYMTIISNAYCYLVETTVPENRGIGLSRFNGITVSGFVLALTISSYALQILGYFLVSLTSFLGICLSWLIIFFFLKESVNSIETNNKDKYHHLFKLSLVKKTLKVTFGRRKGYDRLMIFLIVFVLLSFIAANSTDSVSFLYVREKFHWSLKAYTIYSAFDAVTTTFASVVVIYLLHKLLKINESFIILIGLLSNIISAIVFGLASKSWHIYASSVVGCFYGVVTSMSRSLLSRIIPQDEYGKVFSFLIICETLANSLAPSFFVFIYNQTLLTFPGAFRLGSVGILLITTILCIYIIFLRSKINLKQKC